MVTLVFPLGFTICVHLNKLKRRGRKKKKPVWVNKCALTFYFLRKWQARSARSFLSPSYSGGNFKLRKSLVWVIIKEGCFNTLHPIFHLTNALFGVWKSHSVTWRKSRCDNLSFAFMLNYLKKKKKLLSNIPPDRLCVQKETENCCKALAKWLPCWCIFPLPEWAALVSRTQEDTLFSSFSVNNRLSLFIPLPSSVPPSPAFSFSPPRLWLCASQHQRESSDLWPQQPTLNLAKEGEHPVLRLGGPQIGQACSGRCQH